MKTLCTKDFNWDALLDNIRKYNNTKSISRSMINQYLSQWDAVVDYETSSMYFYVDFADDKKYTMFLMKFN